MEIYPYASVKAKEDPEYLEEARIVTSELQDGKRGYMALWQHIINVSVLETKRLYLNTTFILLLIHGKVRVIAIIINLKY